MGQRDILTARAALSCQDRGDQTTEKSPSQVKVGTDACIKQKPTSGLQVHL